MTGKEGIIETSLVRVLTGMVIAGVVGQVASYVRMSNRLVSAESELSHLTSRVVDIANVQREHGENIHEILIHLARLSSDRPGDQVGENE